MDKKPWLKRNFKKGGAKFYMNLSYIINHLEPRDKQYVMRDVPQDIGEIDCYTASIRGDGKNWWINFLSQDKELEEIDGLVKLILNPNKEELIVQDGRTRLRFYRCRGHEEIPVELYRGAF